MARERKPKRALPSDAPRLDDPRWLPLTEMHKRLGQLIGDDYLAACDLTAALASELRCMRRDIASGVREWVLAAFWADHEYYLDSPFWVVGPRHRRRNVLVVPLTNQWVFYVWGPDVAQRWPALQWPAEAVPPPPPPPRRKPGPPPDFDWPLFVAHELVRRAKAGESDPTAAAMIEHCEKNLGCSPGLKEMQTLLNKLLRGQF